ncbi:MAG: hypothetical protein AAGF12_31325 [Myxococcota bacterium]
MDARRQVVWLVLSMVVGCGRALGPNPFEDAAPPSGVSDSSAPVREAGSRTDAMSSTRGPLDADYFFCQVQPKVINPGRCAGDDGCHTDRTALRLDPVAEQLTPPICSDDHPTSLVEAPYYTNLARSRAEVRPTADRSDFYRRPLGDNHPVTLYREGSVEALIVRAWIEGTAGP